MRKSSTLAQITAALFATTFGMGMAAATFSEAKADTYVRGYTLPNGTYVAPHMRSSPDSSYNNNWSVAPNINPYTGARGHHAPTYNDRSPSSGGLALPSLELPSLELPSLDLD